MPSNYEMWKGAWIRNASGATRTSGLTKKAEFITISNLLDTFNTKKTFEQVMSKMRYVKKKFKEAEDFLRNTGEGLTSTDKKLGIAKIKDKVTSICRVSLTFYFQVKSIMYESVVVNPPYIGITGMTKNIEEMLFGTSIGQGFHGLTRVTMVIVKKRILVMMKRQILRKIVFRAQSQFQMLIFKVSPFMINQIGIFKTWSLRGSLVLPNQ